MGVLIPDKEAGAIVNATQNAWRGYLGHSELSVAEILLYFANNQCN